MTFSRAFFRSFTKKKPLLFSQNNNEQVQTPKAIPGDIHEVLGAYGFNEAQQAAIIRLLRKAEIPDIDKFLARRINTTDEFLTYLLDFVEITQEHFTKRKGKTERWESVPGAWINYDDPELQEILATLHLTEPIAPTTADVDAIGWLGGRGKFVRDRAQYAAERLDSGELNAKHLVLMGGERIVTIDPNIDGSYEQLAPIVSNFSKSHDPNLRKHIVTKPEDLTEFHVMMQAYWDNPSNKFKQLELSVLYAETTNGIRPTTESNILGLCKWLDEHPDVKSIVFISNQPYVQYQEAIITMIMAIRRPDIRVSVIGSKIDWVDAKPVGEFGTQIWTSTVKMVLENKWTTNDPNITARFVERYKGMPFVCEHLKQSLQPQEDKGISVRKACCCWV